MFLSGVLWPYFMQLVTPSVVAMVVSMAIANCTMVFQISFFFIFNYQLSIVNYQL